METSCILADELSCKAPSEVVTKDFEYSPVGSTQLAAGETLSSVGTPVPAVFPTGDANDVVINSSAVSGTVLQLNLSKGRTPLSFTATAADEKLAMAAHGLPADARVRLLGRSLPRGVKEDTSYFVIVFDTNTIQLATEAGGDVIPLVGDGSGLVVILYRLTVYAVTSLSQTLGVQGLMEVK